MDKNIIIINIIILLLSFLYYKKVKKLNNYISIVLILIINACLLLVFLLLSKLRCLIIEDLVYIITFFINNLIVTILLANKKKLYIPDIYYFDFSSDKMHSELQHYFNQNTLYTKVSDDEITYFINKINKNIITYVKTEEMDNLMFNKKLKNIKDFVNTNYFFKDLTSGLNILIIINSNNINDTKEIVTNISNLSSVTGKSKSILVPMVCDFKSNNLYVCGKSNVFIGKKTKKLIQEILSIFYVSKN